MASKNTLDLTQGSIAKKLFALAIPMFFTLVLQNFYNVADKIVVGRFAENGKDALAAIGATSVICGLLVNMKAGLSSGVIAHCSKLRGAGNMDLLRKSMHTSVLLAVVSGTILAIIGVAISAPLVAFLGTPEVIREDAVLYMRLYALGLPAMSAYNFCNGILRSHGDTKRPLYILIVSGVINVVLNIILVVVFKMRVAGVAIATIASQAFSAMCLVKILFDPKDDYKLTCKELCIAKYSLKEIIRIGVPAGISGMVLNFANMTIQSAVNSFNDTSIIAARVAVGDVNSITYQVVHAFALAGVSFAGQCYGAKKYKRIDRLAGTTLLCGGSLLAAASLVCTFFADGIIRIFNSDPAVLEIGRTLLIIELWVHLLYMVTDVLVNCLKGMGYSLGPTVMHVIGNLLPKLLWVWFVFPLYRSFWWLYVCGPISLIFTAVAIVCYYIVVRKKLDRELALEMAP